MPKKRSESDVVETPAGTFKRARFDDRLENYLPDAFYVQESTPEQKLVEKRAQVSRATAQPTEAGVAVGQR